MKALELAEQLDNRFYMADSLTVDAAAELRRSATEDDDPYSQLRDEVFNLARGCLDYDAYEAMMRLSDDDLRTFYLLVAEACDHFWENK